LAPDLLLKRLRPAVNAAGTVQLLLLLLPGKVRGVQLWQRRLRIHRLRDAGGALYLLLL
jgi:hypothetical protein